LDELGILCRDGRWQHCLRAGHGDWTGHCWAWSGVCGLMFAWCGVWLVHGCAFPLEEPGSDSVHQQFSHNDARFARLIVCATTACYLYSHCFRSFPHFKTHSIQTPESHTSTMTPDTAGTGDPARTCTSYLNYSPVANWNRAWPPCSRHSECIPLEPTNWYVGWTVDMTVCTPLAR
jgi:hypothetical protein